MKSSPSNNTARPRAAEAPWDHRLAPPETIRRRLVVFLLAAVALIALILATARIQYFPRLLLGMPAPGSLLFLYEDLASYRFDFNNLFYSSAAVALLLFLAAMLAGRRMAPLVYTTPVWVALGFVLAAVLRLRSPLFFFLLPATTFLLHYVVARSGILRPRLPPRWLLRLGRYRLMLAAAVAALTVFPMAVLAFRCFPWIIDSVSHYFQALLLLSGRFTLEAPPLPEFWEMGAFAIDGRGWYSQYPPGHVLLLAAFELLGGNAWLTNPAFGVATAVLVYRLGVRFHGPRVAFAAVFLLAISPFFLIIQGGWMNHGPTAFLLLLAFWLVLRLEQGAPPVATALAIGLAVGYAFIIRPLTTFALAVPLFVYTMTFVFPRLERKVASLAAPTLAFAAVAALWLVYNRLTTGDFFVTAYEVAWPELHRLGFHEGFGPIEGIRNSLNNIWRLNVYLVGFPLGSYLLPLVHLLFGRLRREEWLMVGLCAALPVAYAFYAYQDFWVWGPRFLYEALPFLVLLSAAGLTSATRAIRRAFRPMGTSSPAPLLILAVYTVVLAGAVVENRNVLDQLLPLRKVAFDYARRIEPIEPDQEAIVFIDSEGHFYLMLQHLDFPHGPIYPKDLGEAENARLLGLFPGKTPYRLTARGLEPYDSPTTETHHGNIDGAFPGY